MRAVLIIARKELAQRLRDRTFFIVGIVAPLVLAFFFNLVMGGLLSDDPDINFEYGLADADGGAVAQAFARALELIEAGGLITVTMFDSGEAAEAAVEDGTLDAAFILPSTLSASVSLSQDAAITVVGNVDSGTGTAVANAIAEQFAIHLGTATLAARTAAEAGVITPLEIAEATTEAAARAPPLTLETVEIPSRQLSTAASLSAGLGIFFIFFVAGQSVTSLLEERSNGTLARLLSAPIRPAAIVAGKTVAHIGLAILATVVLAVASSLLMGADWGNPLLTLILIVAAVVAVAGIMTLVGGLARTPEQAGNLQSIVALTLAMAGGSFVPIAAGDGLLGQLRYATPNAWYLRGLGDAAGGAAGDAMTAVAVLLCIGLVTGGIGLSLVRRVLKP